MRKMISQRLGFALSCALVLLALAGNSQAQTTTFTYQGSLIIGGSVASGSYDLQFKLYDQLAGGSLQGSPNTVTVSGVTVTNGVFTVDLDFGASGFPGAARYLEISVRPASSGSYTTLSPRQQLTSTPYAIRSLSAASADTATTATNATNATNFSGSLTGDVTGTQSATVVASVGGVTASNVASGATLANNATNTSTAGTIVKRDASGNFTAGTITASLNGNATSATSATTATTATNFSGSLTGDVTGPQSATIISTVGGVSASNVASGATAANNATSLNTDTTIVRRDTTGSFSAGVITATGFSGGGANLTNLNASNITTGTLLDSLLSSNVALKTAANTFTANQTVNANLIQSGSLVQFTPTNGFVAGGAINSGSIPATGSGARMMWYPGKAAFRAGLVNGSQWDEANIGAGSVALGVDVKANSISAFALGNSTTASGTASTALGYNTTASGEFSTALGYRASTNGKAGSFVYGDASTDSTLNATADYQFNVRAVGGLRFFASSDTSDETKPGLFISGATGNTQINGNLAVSGTISGTFSGSVANATNFTGSLSGDVTGMQSATIVSSVGGVTASNVASGATLANNATNASTASAIVKRDASGNFSAGTITATGFSGAGANLTNLNASNISSGTLADARLSSNVAKLNTSQTFTANQTIAANLFQTGSLVQFTPTDGFVAGGDAATGSIPATGAGVRMMWYPGKYAFRAGQATGTEWDDANVGYGSMAFGDTTKASNFNTVAMGIGATSSGTAAVAMGSYVTASGNYAVGIGSQSTASGNNAVALGESNQASGNNSVALGRFASTNSKSGSFVFNDVANSNTLAASADNQFSVRAAGGLRLFASSNTSDTTQPGLFISGTTGNTQINGNLTVSGSISGTVSGSGASLSSLNASNVSTGTLADARLSSNVALLNAANTFTANQTVNANLIQSGTLVQFTPTNGLVAGGTVGSGSIPATGQGARMMWYPNKAAFRVGYISGTGWDDANIGDYSVSLGTDTIASANTSVVLGANSTANAIGSVALGNGATASGQFSFAEGSNTTASANYAIALGHNTAASGSHATALGENTAASGQRGTALGSFTTASGNYSTALGQQASTNGKDGSFVYGDHSTSNTINAAADNQFVVRAQQMWFGTNNNVTATSGRFLETSTGAYLSTGGTWANSSSRALKTNFAAVNSREILRKVLQLPMQTWNYKAEDAKVRHIGAISQDFNRLFGFGDSAETISTVDADGVALAAIQGLHEELKDRDARIERLEQQAKQQQAVIDGLRKLLCAQNPQADVCQKQ